MARTVLKSMFTLAFTTMRYNIALYTIVLGVVVMLEMMMKAAGIVTLVFTGLTMLYTHRMIQLNEIYGWADPLSTTGRDGSKVPIVAYILRFFAFFLTFMLILAGVFMALEATGILNPDALLSKMDYSIWGLALGVPTFACALAAIGTVLPACAVRADMSFRAAVRRGQKTFGRTVVNLIVGPVVVALVGFSLLGQAVWLLGGLDGFVVQIILRTVATAITILAAMLTATALSIAYGAAEAS